MTQERKRNGRYGAGRKAMCECGHTLGEHTAERPYECIAHETGGAAEPCGCEEFRKRAPEGARVAFDLCVTELPWAEDDAAWQVVDSVTVAGSGKYILDW